MRYYVRVRLREPEFGWAFEIVAWSIALAVIVGFWKLVWWLA